LFEPKIFGDKNSYTNMGSFITRARGVKGPSIRPNPIHIPITHVP